MKYKYKRKWLNPVTSCYTGYIQYGVNVDQNWVGVTLKISDCSRIVSFDFDDMDTKKGRKLAIKKLKILKDAMDELINDVEKIDEQKRDN